MALAVCVGLWFWIVPASGQQVAAVDAPAAGVDRNAQAPAVKVVAFASQAEAVRNAIVLRGRTEAHRLVEVKAETAGLVVSDPLRAGAHVTVGEVLCRLDSGSREAQLAEMQARLGQAEADAEAAETLAQRGLTAENTAKARRAALEAARAAVRVIQLDIERLELAAPFSGVLETDSAEIGSLVRTGDVCATIISLDPIKVVGFVPESEVDQLAPGMPAHARLVGGRTIAGQVAFVSRSADETTRTFRVEVEAANADESVRDGVTAEILIPVASDEAHLVPQSALTLDDSGVLGVRAVVEGAEGPEAKFLGAEILREDQDGIWLTGLPAETAVIYVGQEFVADGRALEVTWKDWKGAQ
tara:strand:+ start:998 stop:2071 length:1074 start_codon:yes stop_codon:yes gene_type:complete